MIQRRGARFVFKDYRWTSSVSEMLEELKWIPLHERRKVDRLTMLHKIKHGQVAIPAQKFLQPVQTRSSERINHDQNITRLTGRTKYYNSSFFPQTINEWNKLSQGIVNIEDKDIFKDSLTSQITDKYYGHEED